MEEERLITTDWLDMFSDLTDTEFGRLVRWALHYWKGDETALTGKEKVFIPVVKVELDKERERMQRRKQTARENGRRGGRPKNQQVIEKPMGFSETNGFLREGKESGKESPLEEEKKRSKRKEEVTSIEKGKEKAERAPALNENFERFWKCYPKKTGKQAAYKAWSKIRPGAEMTERLINAVEYQKTWPNWNEDNGRYIPNPSTWLNQGRWDDEPMGGGMNARGSTKTDCRHFSGVGDGSF